jgi:predicted nucleic acid-binding Zn ribbon protein
MKIQQAWCGQNLAPVRPFVSDGVFERFSLQVDEQRSLGYRDHMDHIAVDSAALVEFTAGPVFDVATVCFTARAADYRADLKTGERIFGSNEIEPFVEFWAWIRRHGFKSDPNKPGLIEGNCPNCGAAIDMNQSAQCTHCQAILRSGEFDWVLTEITQESEWERGRHQMLAGVAEFRQKDPGISRVGIEDRASVMFWRKMLADRSGKINPLRKIATDDFCRDYAAESLAPQPDGSRPFCGDCALGGVQLLGFAADEDDDNAIVELVWEGRLIIVHPGAALDQSGQRMHVHTLFILKRKTGVSSDPGTSLSSAHCPNCGAPVTSDLSPACTFCGTVLNDGSRGWVLSAVTSAQSDLARQWRQRLAPADLRPVGVVNGVSRKGLLAWAVRVSAADGTVDQEERDMLNSLADKCRVDPLLLNQMIRAALLGRLVAPEPPDAETARTWLKAMAAAALVHGQVQPPEAQLLHRAAARFGISDAEVTEMLSQQRDEHLATARSALQTARQNES